MHSAPTCAEATSVLNEKKSLLAFPACTCRIPPTATHPKNTSTVSSPSPWYPSGYCPAVYEYPARHDVTSRSASGHPRSAIAGAIATADRTKHAHPAACTARGVNAPACVTRVGPTRSSASAPERKSHASFTRFVPTCTRR